VLDFWAWIVASAPGIIAVGDGQSYMTSYLSRKLLNNGHSYHIYILARLRSAEPRALQILVHSFSGQPRYVTSYLAAGGSHTVRISCYIHPPSASAKQAYRPPI